MDFNRFYDITQILAKDPNLIGANPDDSEYSKQLNVTIVDAFVALGGGPGKEGTILKAKLASVLIDDFGLKINMDVR